jgi:transposase
MARAYSDDLRRKLLEAHDRGEASLAELAVRFGVSRGWAWKISAARRRSGQVERRSYWPGPRSRLNEEVLAGLLTDNAEWTLRELQSALKKQTGFGFSTPYLWLRLKRMNFRLKKVAPRSRAGHGSQPKTARRVP